MGSKKHVVSVSLGSSTRDVRLEAEVLGAPVLLERRGVDGDLGRAAALLRELDGQVDALGLGGVVLFVQAAGRRYYLRDALRLARHARRTPVVCGAGLKNTLERRVVAQLEPRIGWRGRRVLMVSGLENFGMAEALAAHGADVTYADAVYFMGWPLPLKSLAALARLARVGLPVIRHLPIGVLYPTGAKQETSDPGWRARYFAEAEVIAGDFHVIRRYAPDDLAGKVIVTNTTTKADVEMLKGRGLRTLLTTTPRLEGRSLATNLLEAALVAVAGKHPLSDADYEELIARAGLGPDVLELNP
jgi:hypothetical protein